jgi:hypothetical protein
VPTKSILNAANVPIIGGHHVLALQGSPEGWQATSQRSQIFRSSKMLESAKFG